MWGVKYWTQAAQVEMLQGLGIWMDKTMSSQADLCTWLCFDLGLGWMTSRGGFQLQGCRDSMKAGTSTGENLSCSLILELNSTKWRDYSHPKLLAVSQQRADLWCEMRSRALAATSCVCNNWVINQCINALKTGAMNPPCNYLFVTHLSTLQEDLH